MIQEMYVQFSLFSRVGADGLKSAVRRALLSERASWMQGQGRFQEAAEIASCIDPAWSGTIAYRALIPAERLRAFAPGHHVLTTPTQVFQTSSCTHYRLTWAISTWENTECVIFPSPPTRLTLSTVYNRVPNISRKDDKFRRV